MTTILKNTTIAGTGHLTIPVGTTTQRPAVNTSIIRWTNTGSQSYSVLAGSTPTLTNTSWTAPAGVNQVEVLVVAGGGQGGAIAAGGAGGVIYNSNFSVTPGTAYTVTVGAGGSTSPGANAGQNGSNSVFGSLTAIGGGGGAGNSYNGFAGGSGGGGGGDNGTNGVAGSATAGQGFSGGTALTTGTAFGGGGGGGAGGPGSNASTVNVAGAGGNGLNFSITGTATWYAGGGGGGAYLVGSTGTRGIGGVGGGGNGGQNGTNATNGTASTGSGGGGNGLNNTGNLQGSPGNGGSGVVILRYNSLSDGTDTRALVRYNTDLRDVEMFEGPSIGWQAQDTARNFAGHNLFTYSEQFDQWVVSGVTVSANTAATLAPDGTQTADKVIPDASTAAHFIYQAMSGHVSGAIYTLTGYAKPAGHNFCKIFAHGSGQCSALFNISTGTFIEGAGTGFMSASITSAGNSWYKISATFVGTTGANSGFYSHPAAFTPVNQAFSDTANGTDGIYLWGAQLEQSSTTGPYIKTLSVASPTPTSIGNYRTHTYTTVGSTTFSPLVSGNVEVLVVAGGGGGSNYNSAGGGGAGGLIYNANYPVIAGRSYTVVVGAGGVGAMTLSGTYTDAIASATSGSNSQFGTLIAIGGGHGGQGNVQGSRTDQYPSAGGSGGGARESTGTVGAAGTVGQGNRGGAGGVYSGNYPGGGGGGAGAPGGDGIDNVTAGEGGAGLQFSISGTPTWYAGGGAGSTQGSGTNSPGGLGGGGAGGAGTGGSTQNGVSGTANTGGGGGAGGFNGSQSVGGNGGSGVVIVRYRYE